MCLRGKINEPDPAEKTLLTIDFWFQVYKILHKCSLSKNSQSSASSVPD